MVAVHTCGVDDVIAHTYVEQKVSYTLAQSGELH